MGTLSRAAVEDSAFQDLSQSVKHNQKSVRTKFWDQQSIHTQTSLNESGSCAHPKQVNFTLTPFDSKMTHWSHNILVLTLNIVNIVYSNVFY